MKNHLQISIFCFLLLSSTSFLTAQQHRFYPEHGDLLFQDLDCGPLCDAIESVTEGYHGAYFSHMGLVVLHSDSTFWVLEATGSGVTETAFQEFIHRSVDSTDNPKVMVARVKEAYLHLIPEVMLLKEKYLGLPYNTSYIWNDSSYYCSQLIYTLFEQANNGAPFFELQPMTFKVPGGFEMNAAWKAYYQELGIEIPEGMPGCNPGGLSRSEKIEVVYFYGTPKGYLESHSK